MSNSLTTMTTGPYPRILHRHAANCMCRARHVLHWPPAENWASIVAHAEFLPQTDVPTITRRQVIEVLSEQIDGRPQPIVFTVTAAICRQQCYLTVDGDFGMPASIFDPHQPGEQHASCWFREATGQTEEQHKVWDFTLEELRMACEREGAESGALFADANAKHGPQLKIFWRQFENGINIAQDLPFYDKEKHCIVPFTLNEVPFDSRIALTFELVKTTTVSLNENVQALRPSLTAHLHMMQLR